MQNRNLTGMTLFDAAPQVQNKHKKP